MWRACGAFLLLLFSQDIGSPYADEAHELKIRPPAGWARRQGQGPLVAGFIAPENLEPACEILVVHYSTSNPTPLKSFVVQAKEFIRDRFKESKIVEERELTVAGRPACRIAFTRKDAIKRADKEETVETLQIKTIVHRTNLEYYLLDAAMPVSAADKYRGVAEASHASLEIVPIPLSSEERVALGCFLDALKGARVDPALLGEQWHSLYIGPKKIGHQRTKVAESEGGYSLELDHQSDFGDEGRITTSVKGGFSADGKYQKIDTEMTKVNAKERWQFRASAVLQNGEVKVSRDMNGYKEERSFKAEEGLVFEDVADALRRLLVKSGKGTFLMKALSLFSDEWNAELVEVNPKEFMEIDGKRQETFIVFSKFDRRKNKTYYYGNDTALLRHGGSKEAFSMRLSSKEEALK